MNHFTTLTSESIAGMIFDAAYQVVYIAPAMTIEIAQAILAFITRTSPDRAIVRMDCDPHVYREGYGDIEALEILEKYIQIQDVRGLRVGILTIDGESVLYVPVTKQNAGLEQKNAITGIPHPFINQTGASAAANIARLREELQRQPLPDFTLQRQLSAYRSLIQFAEITFTGGRLEKTTIKIPSHLLNIAKEKGFEEKMKASYQLFDKSFSFHTKPMTDRVEQLRNAYTHTVAKYGNVILVREKAQFLLEFARVQEEIEGCIRQLQREVARQIEKTKHELLHNFLPILLVNPPAELSESPDMEDVREYIELLLSDEIPHAEEIVKRVELHYTCKDITEDILKDEQFYRQLEKAFKDRQILWPHQQLHQQELSLL